MKKYIILLCLLLFGLGLFYKFGRPVYGPALQKMKGQQTVESVLEQIEVPVYQKLQANLNNKGFSTYPSKILLVALKEERKLEVYGQLQNHWHLLKSYPFTGFSGNLGPKLREGDRQIPEGLYKVSFLNPNSAYHLSIKLNYPNAFDRKKGAEENRKQLGSDIFIHGKNVTIGCIPIGDAAIEEVFLLSAKAINRGILVIVSPRDFRVNPEFPEISTISWENELYEKILQQLSLLSS